ncbi:MAG: alpha/beta hydrolase [Gammaproteobacteria bacterium]|nr:alpha/beta hydrolase [Gammaproteobacteria bacterium]
MWNSVKLKSTIIGLTAFGILIPCLMGMKTGSTDDEWEQWIDDDSEARALAVNEGALEFLTTPPDKPPHELHHKLVIHSRSLQDGWIDLVQCHENLDRVSLAEIMYHGRRTRNIKVLSSIGIERVWVDKNTVQMVNISDNARVCVTAEVHSLFPNFDGTYSMRNGPFHRRFLDGYYPMHVTMDITLPKGELSFGAITPVEQQGFSVNHGQDSMTVDALFVGELNIEVYFDGAGG